MIIVPALSVKLLRTWIGTPNFFINERLVKKVIGIQDIREMVDPLIAGRVASGAGQANN